jgi:hypothetical protein
MDLSKYAAGTKKYMSKDLWDPGDGEDLTIANIREVEFSNRDGSTEHKLVMEWVEDRPPLTLNKTNLHWTLGTFGPNEEHWQGKKVHVFHDPTIKYAGKAVGGVVLDVPRGSRTAPVKQGLAPEVKADLKAALKRPMPTQEELDDDIPF